MSTKLYNMALTRNFAAPVERVWRAWSEAEQVMQWWGPTGFTSPLCKMDFRVGGTTLVCMRAPAEFGGMEMYNTWSYTRIEPQARIEFVQHFSDEHGAPIDPSQVGLPPGIPASVPHVITLRSTGDNATEMTVTEFGYGNEQVVELSKGGMNQCLDKMAALVEGR